MAKELNKNEEVDAVADDEDSLLFASLPRPPPKRRQNFDSTASRLVMAEALNKTEEVKAVVEANSLFSDSLQTHLMKEHPKNLIFSPLSVSTVVAMAKLGARGKTADAIAKGFHFPSDDETLAKGYSQLLPSLNESNDGFTLCQANKLYFKKGIELKEEYLKAVKKSFGAEVEPIDFAKNTSAAKAINGWVKAATKDKIKDLIDPSSLNARTAMLLVNGVYFKGQWKYEFSPRDTKKETFYSNAKETVEVDTMQLCEWLRYVKDKTLDACVCDLPYKGGRISMIIYLPNKRAGLKQLEDGLKHLTPFKILEKMELCRVDVSLPRFEIESTLELVEPLKKLGLGSMFAINADFRGIPKFSDAVPFFVSDVIQKAFIKVNERGTEAAAATIKRMRFGCARPPPRPIKFKADHPFLFQIVDRAFNCVLFAGCVKKP